MMMTDAEMEKRIESAKEAVKGMLVGASLTGVAGATWGACLATIRGESVKFYASSMGANFFLVSSTFLTLEEVIAHQAGRRDWVAGSIAGAATGGFYAGLVAGRLRGLQGAAAGAAVGAAVVLGREQFHKWRLTKAVERYEEKYGTAPKVFYPNTDVLVETKGPVRALEFPSLLPSSMKISEDEIERRIQARVEELRQADAAERSERRPEH
ncbi:hypothetical protein PINS_up020191 [Pythium insidiosum]|nr:hypothetical protein PINS_up015269 [Pythium insidiosum]GLE08776.1 hypothetical protein PINS_up020191 [Pythium insidiosum]